MEAYSFTRLRYLMDALKNVVDYGVIGLLLALSVWAVAIAVERWLFYRHVDVAQFPNQHLCEIALSRRLVIIGTIAANAPYIGLLGTVLGSMLTFHTMGTAGTMAVAALTVGECLSLKATAVGHLVAIRSVDLINVPRLRVAALIHLYNVQHGT